MFFKIQKVPDISRAEHIEKILGKIDDDHDGKIKVDDVLKVSRYNAKAIRKTMLISYFLNNFTKNEMDFYLV